MSNEKSGVYQIRCRATDKIYVGSSKQIYVRWAGHRFKLRRGKHTGVYLQRAWSKYGEAAFVFTILEECLPGDRLAREQHYIDSLKPALNVITDGHEKWAARVLAKRAAGARKIKGPVTHCKHGHEYNETNTYKDKKGRRCRGCNRLRVKGVFAAETPEQRATRLKRMAEYAKNNEEQRAKRAAYAAAHKAEKREYDRKRREAQLNHATAAEWLLGA